MDISIEAIESELAVAQANAGRPMEHAAFARAQIIATLLAGQSAPLSEATSAPQSASEQQAAEVLRVRQFYTEHPDELEKARLWMIDPIVPEGERVGPVCDVDDSTPWHEKIELAAKILGLHQSVLADALISPTERYSPPLEDQPADPGEDPDDDDEDFFAEARKGKK